MKQKSGKLSLFFQRFKNSPYEALDSLDLETRYFQFNVLRDDVKLRKAILQLSIVALIAWIVFGFDSAGTQIEFFVFDLVTGKGWAQAIFDFGDQYGKGFHYSAAVIYGLEFYGISKYLNENLNVKNSLNLSLTTSFVALSISIFEWFWMGSFYYFQHQPWVLELRWAQIRILIQNTFFLIVGLIPILGLNYREVKLNLDAQTFSYFLMTVFLVLFWWGYGDYFPVQGLVVSIVGNGVWANSIYFPQTVYTIDVNLLDNIAIGEQYYIQDNMIHLVNTATKIFMTLTFYSLAKINYKVKEEKKIG